MSTCSNCGAKISSAWTVVKVMIGLAIVGMIGVPMMIVVLLAAIAAIGSSANDDFAEQGPPASLTSVSAPANAELNGLRSPAAEATNESQ